MKRNVLLFKIVCLFFSLFAARQTEAEYFRAHKTLVFSISTDTSDTKIIGINDAIVINLPDDLTFIEGIEIDVKIPQIIADWPDSIVWSMYDDISPKPNENTIDYWGYHISRGILPSRLSWTCAIPFTSENAINDTPYAPKLKRIPDVSERMIFFWFQQAMKGTPDEFEKAELQITVKPILLDKGRLVPVLSAPQMPLLPYTIFVDDNASEIKDNGILLDVGEHTVSIMSEAYRNEVRTVRVDKAKDTVVPITLRSIEPTVQVIAPANTAVYFDAVLIPLKETVTTTEGEHIVRFVIGDYETFRTINVVKGHSYKISLSIDAFIDEE